MSNLKMTIYEAVYELTSVETWANEQEYRQAEEFLIGIGASRAPPDDAVDKNADFYLANLEQIKAFGRYEYSVVNARPRVGPPSLHMKIYSESAGGQLDITWANEEEYQQAKKFLTGMGAPPFHTVAARYENPEFFYLETANQYKALRKFQKSVEEKRKI